MKTIDSGAFDGCAGLAGALSLPSTLEVIGNEAFKNCSNLTGSIDLYEGLTKLRWDAFEGCSSLAGDVAIPSTLTSLESDLFKGCVNLTGTLTIAAGVPVGSSYGTPYTPFEETYFSTIVNNGTNTFDAPGMMADGVNAYYVNEAGEKVTAIETGTYTRKAYETVVDISGATVSDIADCVFARTYYYPEPTVTLNGKTLTKDDEYVLAYRSNYYRGIATVVVKGNAYNGYTGSIEKTFLIGTASTISIADQAKTYTGKALSYDGMVTKTGSGGAVSYAYYSDAACTKELAASKVVNAGTYYVKATVAADYENKYLPATSEAAVFTISAKSATPTVTLAATSYTYSGAAKKPGVTVKVGAATLKAGTDYMLAYSNNTNAGTATVTVKLKGNYSGSKAATFTIVKAANALSAKGKTATVKYAKVKKKAQALAATKAVKFSSKGQGTLTYAKKSGNKKIVVNKKTGKVTVKKGLAKGTYKVKVAVRAAGDANHNAKTVTVTFKVKVK